MSEKDSSSDRVNNPLEELLVSQSEFNRGELLEILKDFIRIDSETGQIIPVSNYAYLSTWQQIVVMLLGYKALKALGKRDSETVGSKELSEMSGINNNSVRSYFSQLETKRVISKVGSEYFVPNYNLEKLRLELMEIGKRES